MDVLEIILTKAYALYSYRVQPRPREKELFSMLSSISRNWHKTIYRRWFKAALNRRLYPYIFAATKRKTIIRSNRQYLEEHLEPSSNLIGRLERVGCLTREEENYIESLEHNIAKNHELLNVTRTMSSRLHSAFVESLHFCGQLKVADILEKGGVVFKMMARCSGVSTEADFFKRLNEKIFEAGADFGELDSYIRLFGVAIPKELEVLEVQPVGRKRGKEHIVVWLWCKSHKSSRQLCKLAESDQLLKLLDILITFIWWKGTQHLYDLLRSFRCDTLPLQFLKTLRLKTLQFHRTIAVRQLSVKLSGEFNLPLHSRAVTSLDDKIYILTDHLISVHQWMAPYALQCKTVFPPSESQAVYPGYRGVFGSFIGACHQRKCIYVARSNDQRVWKLTTPECNLEVWMFYSATLCSLSLTSNGHILILKVDLPDGARFLEIFTHDAVRIYNINLDIPLYTIRPESPSVLEMSPGNFVVNCQNALFLKSVNFDTQSTTDQNRIQYSSKGRKPYYGPIASIALYSVNRLISVGQLNRVLTILDSRLNAEIISNSNNVQAETLHYRKDKRQLMACSSGMKSAQIYTLHYEGEDLVADNGDLKLYE